MASTIGPQAARSTPGRGIDTHLDVDAVLPFQVAIEAERAATLLARVAAYPVGVVAWRDYHQRFYERYGIGSLVPVLEVVSGAGIGWPDGYPDTITPEPLPGRPCSWRARGGQPAARPRSLWHGRGATWRCVTTVSVSPAPALRA